MATNDRSGIYYAGFPDFVIPGASQPARPKVNTVIEAEVFRLVAAGLAGRIALGALGLIFSPSATSSRDMFDPSVLTPPLGSRIVDNRRASDVAEPVQGGYVIPTVGVGDSYVPPVVSSEVLPPLNVEAGVPEVRVNHEIMGRLDQVDRDLVQRLNDAAAAAEAARVAHVQWSVAQANAYTQSVLADLAAQQDAFYERMRREQAALEAQARYEAALKAQRAAQARVDALRLEQQALEEQLDREAEAGLQPEYEVPSDPVVEPVADPELGPFPRYRRGRTERPAQSVNVLFELDADYRIRVRKVVDTGFNVRRRDVKIDRGYRGALSAISASLGEVTEVVDIVEAWLWNIKEVDTGARTMAVTGGDWHETVKRLAQGKARLDVRGFLASAAFQLVADAFFAKLSRGAAQQLLDAGWSGIQGPTYGPAMGQMLR